MGLPRIVSNADDLAFITGAVDSVANGITLCSGSLGAGANNDVPAIARRFAERIHFAHLRNVRKEPDGSFMEADHLGGDTDMVALVEVLLKSSGAARKQAIQTGASLCAQITGTSFWMMWASPPTLVIRPSDA